MHETSLPTIEVVFHKASLTGSFLLRTEDCEACVVTVTRRGILNAASPPRASAARFVECLETFRAVALEKLSKSQRHETLELTAEDIRRWRRRHSPPFAGRYPAPIVSLDEYREQLRARSMHTT